MKKGRYDIVVGIDEVGRGPLAGPLTLCACAILASSQKKVLHILRGITDSKQLKPHERETFFEKIQILQENGNLSYSIVHVLPRTIDSKGMRVCLKDAVGKVLKKLNVHVATSFVYLDGSLSAPALYHQETVIKGDEKILEISIASVIAKVIRDRKMIRYAKKFPKYGFDVHKGYGTLKHREAIQKYGPCALHRITWLKY